MNEFKDVMRGLCQTIGVVTACDQGRWAGMTASSIVSVSMDPAALLVCVNKGASIHPVIANSRRFNINFLSDDQEEMSRLFSGQIPNEERFAAGRWSAADGHPPELAGAHSVVRCDLECASAFATHTIFIGRVRDVKRREAAFPLVYFDGGYRSVRPAAKAACA